MGIYIFDAIYTVIFLVVKVHLTRSIRLNTAISIEEFPTKVDGLPYLQLENSRSSWNSNMVLSSDVHVIYLLLTVHLRNVS